MILIIKANKIQPLQDQEIIKANQVEEDQPAISKIENFLDQRQNAKKDVFIIKISLSSFRKRCGGMERRWQ